MEGKTLHPYPLQNPDRGSAPLRGAIPLRLLDERNVSSERQRVHRHCRID
jgi:hypothetical protein